MPRDIPIENDRLLAAFDFDYRIRDFYYPRIGKENHALGLPWHVGIWVEGFFSWVDREEGLPGSPWLICTLWLAQCRTAAAKDRKALDEVLPLLLWTAERGLSSGVLGEQVHSQTGEFLSVSPLAWSHATFVAAVLDYVEKALRVRRVKPLRVPFVRNFGDTILNSGYVHRTGNFLFALTTERRGNPL